MAYNPRPPLLTVEDYYPALVQEIKENAFEIFPDHVKKYTNDRDKHAAFKVTAEPVRYGKWRGHLKLISDPSYVVDSFQSKDEASAVDSLLQVTSQIIKDNKAKKALEAQKASETEEVELIEENIPIPDTPVIRRLMDQMLMDAPLTYHLDWNTYQKSASGPVLDSSEAFRFRLNRRTFRGHITYMAILFALLRPSGDRSRKAVHSEYVDTEEAAFGTLMNKVHSQLKAGKGYWARTEPRS